MSVFKEPKQWLVESISSIIAQTYNDIEIIVVVDNPYLAKESRESFDYLTEIKRMNNNVQLIFNEQNLGLASSLNIGINASNGDFIARMDADDISLPTRLEKEMAFLSEYNVDMVSTNGFIIDEKSNIVDSSIGKMYFDPTNILPNKNCILHPSVLVKKSVLIDVGLYRNFRRSQDYDLWLRMISLGYKIRTLDENLVKYRKSNDNLSNTNRLEQYYTNLYQKKLFIERQKKGIDSFSEKNYRRYILSKKITPKKNEKCKKCMLHLNNAKRLKENGKSCFKELFRAFFCYPSIVLRSVLNSISGSSINTKRGAK